MSLSSSVREFESPLVHQGNKTMTDFDIYERLEGDWYRNKELYPGPRPKRPVIGKKGYEQAQVLVDEIFDKKLKVWERARKRWDSREREIVRSFRHDALEYVGLTNYPKADKVFAQAWDRGHSAGKHQVVSILEDLAELIVCEEG